MGLDDLVDDHEEESERERAEEIADELGIDNKEELEQLDGRISRIFEHIILLDAEVDRLSTDVNQMKKLLNELIQTEMESDGGDTEESEQNSTVDDWLGFDE